MSTDPTITDQDLTMTAKIARRGACTVCGRKCQQTYSVTARTGAGHHAQMEVSLKGMIATWLDANPYATCSRCRS